MNRTGCLLAALLLSFIMGVQDGYVALWKSGETEPLEVFPYQVSSLPPADQARLRKGIVIDSAEDLIGLIEDYLS